MTSYKTILNIRPKSHMELFNCGIESALLGASRSTTAHRALIEQSKLIGSYL